MIYEVKKNDITLQIDDNVLFDKQPKEFRQMYKDARITEFDNVEFDNCYVEVNEHRRLIITYKIEEDGTIQF